MQKDIEAFTREINLLNQYNQALQVQNARKNQQIKFFKIQLERFTSARSHSRYNDECANCFNYRKQITELKNHNERLQELIQYLTSNSAKQENKLTQVQSKTTLASNWTLINPSSPNSPVQHMGASNEFEQQIGQLKEKLQNISIENKQLKKIIRQKNEEENKINLLSEKRLKETRQERQKILKEQAKTIGSLRYKIQQLQLKLFNLQKNQSIFLILQKENQSMGVQLKQNKQLLDQYENRIHDLTNEIQRIINYHPQKKYLENQLEKVYRENTKLESQLRSVSTKYKNNIDTTKDLKRRINILQQTNKNLQSQLSNLIEKKLRQSSYRTDNQIKIMLLDLKTELEEIKRKQAHQNLNVNEPYRDIHLKDRLTAQVSRKLKFVSSHGNLFAQNKSPKQQNTIKQELTFGQKFSKNHPSKWKNLNMKINFLEQESKNLKQLLYFKTQ